MGLWQKGSNSASKGAADVSQQTKMSSFFRPEVTPMFEKPQNSLAAGQSAAGGVDGSANAGSGSVAASGAAGAGDGEPETVVVVDDDGVDGGDATQDQDATESENETTDPRNSDKQPPQKETVH